jgi:stage II sporulation protein AA (anti-sigma F factor antagonist)
VTDSARLDCDVTRHDGVITVVVRGELDPHTVASFQSTVDGLELDGASAVILDLASLDFVDSAGLRVWVQLHHELEARGGQLVLRSPGATVARLLDVTGLGEALTVEP